MKAKRKWDVLHSSKKEDWATPQALFDGLAKRFGPFDLDVCANETNGKCAISIEYPRRNALEMEWTKFGMRGAKWMNPPYGRSIGRWMEKAYEESQKGCRVVCLVPARTGSSWFVTAGKRASEINFIVGRITFDGARSPAPFDSAVIVFSPERGKTQKITWITRAELMSEERSDEELYG